MTQPEPAWQRTWLRGVGWTVLTFVLVWFALDTLAPLIEDRDAALWMWGALYALGLAGMGFDGARHAHHVLLPGMVGFGCIFLTTMVVSIVEAGEQSTAAILTGLALAALQLVPFCIGLAAGWLRQRSA